MPEVEINYTAVIVAAVLSLIAGLAWYGPLFGKEWMKLTMFDQRKTKEIDKVSRNKTYFINFVATLVSAYVLSYFISYAQAVTITEGLQVGFWVWLGFIVTTTVTSVLYEGKPWRIYQINTGYQLVSYLLMAAVLTTWR
jgi:hypothetical protein